MKTIYIGNLPFKTNLMDIKELFLEYGDPLNLNLIYDKETKNFKGFAFLEMEDGAALIAIQELHGKTFKGRKLRVTEAETKRKNNKSKFDLEFEERQKEEAMNQDDYDEN